FAMSRHMGEHPTMIGELVAIAMASVAIEPLQEMLELPDCPNLFWALTSLPDPFISIRQGMDGERLMVEMFFREFDSTAPMTNERIERSIEELGELDKLISQDLKKAEPGGLRAYLAKRTKSPQRVSEASKRLIASGLPEARVKSFPPAQVVLLDEARECLVRF